MCVDLYFHRYSGVLRGHLTEHTEELWAKAWRSQPHGGQVGKGCFCPKLWTGKFCLPSGRGESPTSCLLEGKKTKEFAGLIFCSLSKTRGSGHISHKHNEEWLISKVRSLDGRRLLVWGQEDKHLSFHLPGIYVWIWWTAQMTTFVE